MGWVDRCGETLRASLTSVLDTCELARLGSEPGVGLYILRAFSCASPVVSTPPPPPAMLADRSPSSHSEQRLRSALHRTHSASAPRHRRSHASAPAPRPATMSSDMDDDLSRAAFLYRTAATASSPIHPPRSYSRPISPSPSQHDEPDPRTMPRRKTSSLTGEESCPLSRARLERVLRNGRVVEGRSRSREPSRRDSDSSTPGWPWSDNHSAVRLLLGHCNIPLELT
jgi:hypothetical protein